MYIVCNCNAQTNDLKEMGYSGDIESIISTDYELYSKFGEEQIGNMISKSISKFNNDGNELEYFNYDLDGNLLWKHKKTYDEKGDLLEECGYNYSDGNKDWKHKYKYDEKGNLLEECIFDSGCLHWKYTYTYDEKGNRIEEKYYEYTFEVPRTITKYEIIYR